MKVQAVDNFTSKLSLIADTALMQKLSGIVTKLEASVDVDAFLSGCQYNDGVYSFQLDSYTLYFSIINDELYFVDIIEPIQVFRGISRKNPRLNSMINPKINSRINPNINSRINPRINSRLNPNINSRINPRINSRLNPNINSRINPKINSRLNPNINSSLNPRVNNRINPKITTNMDCRYVYDLATMKCLYYSIEVGIDDIIMIYDYQQIKPVFFGVKRETGYCIYKLENNEYVGFWESNGADGFNWFDNSLMWTCFVV